MLGKKKSERLRSIKTSFSQSGEDLIIRFIFDALKIRRPSFLDIGAHHPFFLNNTAIFYDEGSRGINIEPDPVLFDLFQKVRKEDINLNCGVADKNDTLTLYRMSVPTMNTFSKAEAEDLVEKHQFTITDTIPIPVLTITSLLEKHNQGRFPDLLTLDVEGMDEQIIRTISFEKDKPAVICLETISYSEKGLGAKNREIIDFLCQKGYMVYADTYINTIFVLRDKWLKTS